MHTHLYLSPFQGRPPAPAETDRTPRTSTCTTTRRDRVAVGTLPYRRGRVPGFVLQIRALSIDRPAVWRVRPQQARTDSGVHRQRNFGLAAGARWACVGSHCSDRSTPRGVCEQLKQTKCLSAVGPPPVVAVCNNNTMWSAHVTHTTFGLIFCLSFMETAVSRALASKNHPQGKGERRREVRPAIVIPTDFGTDVHGVFCDAASRLSNTSLFVRHHAHYLSDQFQIGISISKPGHFDVYIAPG